MGNNSKPVKLKIVDGMIENLPEVMDSVKEIYRVYKKEKVFNKLISSKMEEMNIKKENFNILVNALTELSKSPEADEETKNMYRDMIKFLFEYFQKNTLSMNDLSDFLKQF